MIILSEHIYFFLDISLPILIFYADETMISSLKYLKNHQYLIISKFKFELQQKLEDNNFSWKFLF